LAVAVEFRDAKTEPGAKICSKDVYNLAVPSLSRRVGRRVELAALPGRSMGKARSSPIPSIYPVDSVIVPIEIPGFCRGRPMGKIVNHGDFRID
jgi:hypothetical protein